MNISKRKKIKKKLRLKTIFFLFITLASNSFAWFVYTTKVSSSFTTKVREWKVSFDVNGVFVDHVIELNVESIYPGMADASQEVIISNSGESTASVEYEILEASILGNDLTQSNMTDIEILDYLRNNYPFSINFDLSVNELLPNSDTTVDIGVSWPYESGNDEEDSYWGNEAYNFHFAHPAADGIKLVIKLTAFQAEE